MVVTREEFRAMVAEVVRQSGGHVDDAHVDALTDVYWRGFTDADGRWRALVTGEARLTRPACGECSICYAAKLLDLAPRADLCLMANP